MYYATLSMYDMHMCTHVQIVHGCVCTRVNVHVRVCMLRCMYLCTCMNAHVWMYVCMHCHLSGTWAVKPW